MAMNRFLNSLLKPAEYPPTAVLHALPFSSTKDLYCPVQSFQFPVRDHAVVFVLAKTGGGKSATLVRLLRMAAETTLFRHGRFAVGFDLPMPTTRAASDLLVWDAHRPVLSVEVEELRKVWKLCIISVQASRNYALHDPGLFVPISNYTQRREA